MTLHKTHFAKNILNIILFCCCHLTRMFYKSNIQTRIRRALICCIMLQLLFQLLEVKNNKTNKNIVNCEAFRNYLLFELFAVYLSTELRRQFIDVEMKKYRNIHKVIQSLFDSSLHCVMV